MTRCRRPAAEASLFRVLSLHLSEAIYRFGHFLTAQPNYRLSRADKLRALATVPRTFRKMPPT